MSVLSEKGRLAEDLINRSDIYAWLTDSALKRKTMDFGGRKLAVDSLGDKPIVRTLSFDYQQPVERFYFDHLILPRIHHAFEMAANLEISRTIKKLYTPQGLYAIQHGGVRLRDFDQISAHLEKQRGQTVVFVDFRMPQVA